MVRTFTVCVCTAIAVLGLAAATRGETLRFEPGEGLTLASLGVLTLSDSGRSVNVACAVQLTGTLRREELEMTVGKELGRFTSSRVETCSGGTLELLGPRAEAPWRFTYQAFTGTLPAGMTALKVKLEEIAIQASVTIIGMAVRCLYRGTTELLMNLSAGSEYRVGLWPIIASEFRRSSGSALCPERATLSGTLNEGVAQEMRQLRATWGPENGDFREVRVGQSSIIRAIYRNATGGIVTVREGVLRGSGCAHFAFDERLVRERDRINSEESRAIDMTFRPTSTGGKPCDFELVSAAGARYIFVMYGVGI